MKAKMIYHPMGETQNKIFGKYAKNVLETISYSQDGFVESTIEGTKDEIEKVTKRIFGSINNSIGFVRFLD